MKRFFTTKFFIAVLFFCVGFLTNHFLVKFKSPALMTAAHEEEERFPINPADFDHKSMLESIARMNDEGGEAMIEMGGEIAQREDDKFFYYEIPLKDPSGAEQKLNVEIKNGMIKISQDLKSSGDTMIQSSSERMFSIPPGLDGDRAEVINEKEKIVIKIPKR